MTAINKSKYFSFEESLLVCQAVDWLSKVECLHQGILLKNNERWSKWKKMSDFPIIADVVFQNMKREELGLKHTILNSQGPEKKTNLIYTFFMEFFDCTLELLPSHSPMSKMTDLSLRNNAAKWRLST